MTIPYVGRFVGETMTLDYCAPQTGVMTCNNGSWGIIYETQLRALGTKGQPLTAYNLSLSSNGTLTVNNINHVVTFDASQEGNRPRNCYRCRGSGWT